MNLPPSNDLENGDVMKDITQVLDRLSPQISNVLRQAQSGGPDAVSDAALHQAYRQVAPQLTREEFQQAASEAYDRMTPDERSRIAEHLRAQAEPRDLPMSTLPSAATAATDPGALAAATADMNDREPNLLQDLFAPGGTFSSPLAKAALLGITAFAAQRLSHRF
jgi:hypothetical protein